jgi:hypothetical protein
MHSLQPSVHADTLTWQKMANEAPMNVTKLAPVPLRPRPHSIRIHSLFLVFTLLSVVVTPLFARTKIVHSWVLAGQPMPKFKKILVIAVMENYLIRQEFEDEMERLLAKSGIEGTRSHMVLPPRNELMEGELKQRIKEADYDAVLVIRPKAFRKETVEVGSKSIYMPPTVYQSFWPYWDMAFKQYSLRGSYLKENTMVSAEFNLYRTTDETLLWSGETDTVYSKNFEKLAKEYANTLVKQLKKDKVIPKS